MEHIRLGRHLIMDMQVENWNILEDVEEIKTRIENVVKEYVTILSFSYHDFGENFGVTAIWLLSESHISIHTWPEFGTIAIDIFTCGDINPTQFVEGLEREFNSIRNSVYLRDRELVIKPCQLPS